MKYIFLFLLVFVAAPGYAQVYFLNGDAQFLGEDCYQLTGEINYQNGTVWYGDQVDLNEPFDLQFQMNFGSLDASGADGICFVLQTVGTAAIGESGGGLGYLNFGTSLGIEFDTWQNGEYGDPWEDHIAIERDGDINHNSINNIAGPVQMDPFDANVEDGENHVVQVLWDPETQEISVYFDCNFRLQGTVDLINDVFNGQNLVYWGFTAATGGAVNNQTVCLQENILSVGDEVEICPGASTILSAGSSLNGTYTWTPADFLDDPASATPIANPPVTTTYNVTFTNLCGDNVSADITVTVTELEVTLPPAPEITCINDLITLIPTTNFNDVNYTWTTQDGNIVNDPGTGSIQVDAAGTYLVVADFQGVCSDQTEVVVSEDTAAPLAEVSGDEMINCAQPTGTLEVTTNSGNATFLWQASPGEIEGPSNGSSVNVSAAGVYSVIVTNTSNGCSATATADVGADFTEPELIIAEQDSLNCFLNQFALSDVSFLVQGNAVWQWTTDDGSIVSGANSQAPLINAAGTYEAVLTDDSNGCSTAASVEVFEDDDFDIDLSALALPNVVTPNEDDKNTVWRVFLENEPDRDLSAIFSEYDLLVFNRWGQLMFESTPGERNWNASDVASGVYYYILTFRTACGGGISNTYEGYIHVLR